MPSRPADPGTDGEGPPSLHVVRIGGNIELIEHPPVPTDGTRAEARVQTAPEQQIRRISVLRRDNLAHV